MPRDVWIPFLCIILDITNEVQALITTRTPHAFLVGDFVRILVPEGYGMFIYYELTEVLAVPRPDQLRVSLNTLNLDPFNRPILGFEAQVIPVTGVEDNITR